MKKLAAMLMLWSLGATLATAQIAKAVTAPLVPSTDRKVARSFDLFDSLGKVVRLSDFRGRVVLLDFWATNCAGCVQEIPMFIEVDKTYRPRGLTAIGVSEDIPYSTLKGPDEAWARVK